MVTDSPVRKQTGRGGKTGQVWGSPDQHVVWMSSSVSLCCHPIFLLPILSIQPWYIPMDITLLGCGTQWEALRENSSWPLTMAGRAVDGGLLVAPGAECCSGEYKKAKGKEENGDWVVRRAGRCWEWCEDARGHVLSSLGLSHLLRACGLQQSSHKSRHCLRALSRSCLKGL